jgi:hypothetical protein
MVDDLYHLLERGFFKDDRDSSQVVSNLLLVSHPQAFNYNLLVDFPDFRPLVYTLKFWAMTKLILVA